MDLVPAQPPVPGDDAPRPTPILVETPTGQALWPTFLRRSLPSAALDAPRRRAAAAEPSSGPGAA